MKSLIEEIKDAIKDEERDNLKYERMANIAKKAGYREIETKLREIQKDEQRHARCLREKLSDLKAEE